MEKIEKYNLSDLLLCDSFESMLMKFPIKMREFVNSLSNLPERLDYHPEGNTYDHIKIVVERLMDTKDTCLIIAAFFHDLGKKSTFKLGKPTPEHPDGVPQAPGHERESVKIFDEMIKSNTFPFSGLTDDDEYKIRYIIKNHMRMKTFWDMKASKKNNILSCIFTTDLITFVMADSMLQEWTWSERNIHLNKFDKIIEFYKKYNLM